MSKTLAAILLTVTFVVAFSEAESCFKITSCDSSPTTQPSLARGIPGKRGHPGPPGPRGEKVVVRGRHPTLFLICPASVDSLLFFIRCRAPGVSEQRTSRADWKRSSGIWKVIPHFESNVFVVLFRSLLNRKPFDFRQRQRSGKLFLLRARSSGSRGLRAREA